MKSKAFVIYVIIIILINVNLYSKNGLFEYKLNGNVKTWTKIIKDQIIKYFFDKNGFIINKDFFTKSNNLICTNKYFYEKETLQIIRYDEYNNIINKYIKYYQNENLVEEKCFGKNNLLISQNKYFYDENNNQIKNEEYDSNGDLTTIIENKFDKNCLIEILFFRSPHQQLLKTEIFYDENGFISKEKIYDRNNKLVTERNFINIFDNHNNLTRKIDSKNKKIIEENIYEYW